MDWMIIDEGEINHGPFNLSTSGNNSHNSSAKSSISASTDSTADYNVHQTPSFRFGSKFEGCAESWSKKIAFGGMGLPGDSPPFGSGEQSIGLKLGKRTYFENTVKSTSMGAVKKNRAPGQNGPVYCQVQGCGADLSSAKDYHKKHRVCDSHSKSQKVMVGGIELRFCQQCSRFHSLSEFDEKKRSCRKRLSDHNARRRKPQQQTIQFNSPTLSSTFNGGGIHQMSFLVNNSPPVRPMTCAKSAWGDDNTHTAAKFTLTKGSYPLKSGGDGSSNQRLHMLGGTISPPPIIDMQNVSSASKNSTIQAFNPVSKGSLMSSLDNAAAAAAATAPHRASSLLSSAYEPMQQHVFGEPMIQTIPEGVPVSSSEFWLSGHQSVRSNDHHAMATSSTFQEFQLLKESYEADYYSNIY